jgi:hypothetical protein
MQKSPIPSLAVDLRVISAILLATNLVTLGVWRPWSAAKTDNTIVVTGKTTIKRTPDEFIFSPYLERTDKDQTVASKQISETGNMLFAKLKELGYTDADLEPNMNISENYLPAGGRDGYRGIYSIQITANSLELAQKTTALLSEVGALGSTTPSPTFSIAKTDQLEQEAQDAAIKNAKEKAKSQADALGRKLGKVVTVGTGYFSDNGSYPYPMPFYSETAKVAGGGFGSSTTLSAGSQEATYSIDITYSLR